MPRNYEEFLDQANSTCHDLAPVAGELTGKLYGYGAEIATHNVAVSKGVDEVIGNFVEHGWPDLCDLPSNLANLVSDEPAQAPAGPSQGPDNSISPAD